MGHRIWSGECGFGCATSWAALSPWLTLVLVPISVIALWRGHEYTSSLLLALVAANWLLFEVIGVELACVHSRLYMCAVPLLAFATLVASGGHAIRRARSAGN
jgi:hypothetical protein